MSEITFTTRRGNVVDLENPDPATLVPADIADGLSRLPRYAGATPQFLSVAEHLVRTSKLAEGMGEGPEAQLVALLLDGHEAFGLGDVARPTRDAIVKLMKYGLGANTVFLLSDPFTRWKDIMDSAIRQMAGIARGTWEELHPVVYEMKTEVARVEQDWRKTESQTQLQPMTMIEAATAWLTRYNELQDKIRTLQNGKSV